MFHSKYLRKSRRKSTQDSYTGELNRRDLFRGLAGLGVMTAIPADRFPKDFDFRAKPTPLGLQRNHPQDYEGFVKLLTREGKVCYYAPVIMRFRTDTYTPTWITEPGSIVIPKGTLAPGEEIVKMTVSLPPKYRSVVESFSPEFTPEDPVVWDGSPIDNATGDVVITFDPDKTLTLS